MSAELLYLSGGSLDGPAAVHGSLVESLGLEDGPLRLVADSLVVGQGGGTVSDTGVSPDSHLVHGPCRQVCSCSAKQMSKGLFIAYYRVMHSG